MIVVGAGPSGSAAAYWMATAGLDVLLLEKTSFPREKVCGDGLTPRGTRALVEMGIDVSEEAGWLHNKGLRVIGGGLRLELDWPELASFPAYGLVRPRADLDHLLVRQAVKAGARLHEQTSVTGPMLDRQGRVVGVQAKAGAGPGRPSAATGRRSCWPATGCPAGSRWRWACSATTSGRWAWRCAATTPARAPTTTTWSPGWSCGTARPAPTTPSCCPATAGSSGWATARSTSAWAC